MKISPDPVITIYPYDAFIDFYSKHPATSKVGELAAVFFKALVVTLFMPFLLVEAIVSMPFKVLIFACQWDLKNVKDSVTSPYYVVKACAMEIFDLNKD